MKKKWWIIAIIVLLVVLGVGWLHHNSKRGPAYTTISPSYRDIQDKVMAVGNILPKHKIMVRSPISGKVAQIFKDTGDQVHVGSSLLRIAPNPTPTESAQDRSSVAADKARVESDKKKLSGDLSLLKNKIITPLDTTLLSDRSQLKVDNSQFKFDQQKLDLITKGSTVIAGVATKGLVISPINGYILARNVDRGDSVIALGSAQIPTNLFSIANMKDLVFKGSVDENNIHKLKKGMDVVIQIGALPKLKLKAKLTRISLQSSEQDDLSQVAVATTTTGATPFNVGFLVEASGFKLPAGIDLLSGYSATASMIYKQQKHVLSLPESAIVFKGDKHFVKVLGANNKVTEVPVQLGISNGEYVAVSGVTADDHVVRSVDASAGKS